MKLLSLFLASVLTFGSVANAADSTEVASQVFEFARSSNGETACFLQEGNQSIGTGVDFSLCEFHGRYNAFEFESASNGETACFLQRDGRSVGTGMDFGWCSKYGAKSTFKFGISSTGSTECFLQREGRSVGTAMHISWCDPEGELTRRIRDHHGRRHRR